MFGLMFVCHCMGFPENKNLRGKDFGTSLGEKIRTHLTYTSTKIDWKPSSN